jgi:hypothetical protein
MRLASRPSPAGRLTLTLRTKIALKKGRWQKLRQAPGPPVVGIPTRKSAVGNARSKI